MAETLDDRQRFIAIRLKKAQITQYFKNNGWEPLVYADLYLLPVQQIHNQFLSLSILTAHLNKITRQNKTEQERKKSNSWVMKKHKKLHKERFESKTNKKTQDCLRLGL